MYRAIEDMLPQLEELDLLRHMVPEHEARSADDEKLLRYIRIFRHLHPRVWAERRVSRTGIFDALFSDNQQALAIAHKAYDDCYRRHFSTSSQCQFDTLFHPVSALSHQETG
jgi:phosphoglycolate phosphatase